MAEKGKHLGGGHFETKYREHFPALLKNHLETGYSFRTFAAVVDVNPTTVKYWLETKPEFAEAKEIGERLAERFYERKAIDLIEQHGSAPTLKMVMAHRFDYKDKQEVSADADTKALLAGKPLIQVVFRNTETQSDKPKDE